MRYCWYEVVVAVVVQVLRELVAVIVKLWRKVAQLAVVAQVQHEVGLAVPWLRPSGTQRTPPY